MKPEAAAAALKNAAAARSDSLAAVMGSQLGALQAHHQQQMSQAAAVAAANKVATSMANMNLRSHVSGHGGPVGMPQQASTPGPTYSPTPIQRPQGKY
jgi:predicted TIM-barrel enzyme